VNAYEKETTVGELGLCGDDSGPDMVNHPPHYARGDHYEPIKVIEAWELGFHLGNCVKYIARYKKKGTPLQDLKKARWYLDRKIARMEGRETSG
jgi:hypothetical protein